MNKFPALKIIYILSVISFISFLLLKIYSLLPFVPITAGFFDGCESNELGIQEEHIFSRVLKPCSKFIERNSIAIEDGFDGEKILQSDRKIKNDSSHGSSACVPNDYSIKEPGIVSSYTDPVPKCH